MRCIFCNEGKTRPGRTTFTSDRDGKVVVILDVPAKICGTCGEAYFAEDVAERVYQQADSALDLGTQIGVLRYAA